MKKATREGSVGRPAARAGARAPVKAARAAKAAARPAKGEAKTARPTARLAAKGTPKRAPATRSPRSAAGLAAGRSATVARPARTAATARAATRGRPPSLPALVKIGREVLGIEELRPGQAEGLRHVLAGRDVLAVMPTGSGKSLLYQLPSLVLRGMTVVVSPLIALIKDQVEKMRDRGVTALRIDSTLTKRQKQEMMDLAAVPGGKLLLTTPERMSDLEFRRALREAAGPAGLSLFVVDEAHCVSQWGHDFRPAYLVLREAIDELGRPPVLGTTATAPPHVRDDILHQLGMPKARLVTTSFERPNLHFEVIPVPGEDDKKKVLVSLLKKLPRPGIVYCATVKAVEQLGEELGRHGIPVATYHGRMTKNVRDEQQARFMETGASFVMVATNAFGLGVDKADIRYVLHYHVPGSLEQYAQEAGRAGRDGKPSRCVLLFSPDDVAIQEYFLKGTYPSQRQVMSVVATLEAWGDEGRPPTLGELAESSHVGKQRTRTVLALLKDEGWVEELRGGRFRLASPTPDREAIRTRAQDYEKRRIADRQRLEAVLAYVRADACRNQIILEYLGEQKAERCGRCDNDLRSAVEARAAARNAAALEEILTRLAAEAEGAEHELEAAEQARRVVRTRVISVDDWGGPLPTRGPASHRDPDPEATGQAASPAAPAVAASVLPIDVTAAELAAADDLEAGEITVLKRKRQPKPPRGPKVKAVPPPPPAEGHKRRRKRRRHKKAAALTQAPGVFTSPVLVVTPGAAPSPGTAPSPGAAPSSAAPPSAPAAGEPRPVDERAPIAAGAPPVAPGASGTPVAQPTSAAPETAAPPTAAALVPPSPARPAGPIVEYVRRPMKIAVQPVASATPHDTGARHRRRGAPFRHGRPGGGPSQGPGSPRPAQGGFTPPPAVTAAGPDGAAPGGGKKRKRRRRRHRKNKQPGMAAPVAGGASGGGGAAGPAQADAGPQGPRPLVMFWTASPSRSGGGNGGHPAAHPQGATGPGFTPPGQAAGPGQPGQPGSGKRRRRRRRRRHGAAAVSVAPGTGAPGPGGLSAGSSGAGLGGSAASVADGQGSSARPAELAPANREAAPPASPAVREAPSPTAEAPPRQPGGGDVPLPPRRPDGEPSAS